MQKKKRLVLSVLAVSLVVGTLAGESGTAAGAAKKIQPQVTASMTVKEGKTKKITVAAKYLVKKTFQSTDTSVATVTKAGKVRGKGAGECKIKVKVRYKKSRNAKKIHTKKFTCNVNVTAVSDQNTYEVMDNFVRQSSSVSLKLLQTVCSKDLQEKKNVLISPESILTCMMMVTNGAASDTLSEMRETFCGNMALEEFNQNMAEYHKNLISSEEVSFHIADSIWVKEDAQSPLQITLKEAFQTVNETYYDAGIFKEPFDQGTVEKVNSWVKESTDGMIPEIIGQFGANDLMCIINALAFEGKWAKQYTEDSISENQTFTNASGEKESVTMLNGSEYHYIEGEHCKGFVKYYEGGKYAFMALLPEEGMTNEEFLSSLSGADLTGLYQSRSSEKVLTRMPEFSYDFSANLVEALQKMGIKSAFDAERADFSNMADVRGGNLFVSDVLHKTHIELDRNGTKAAAVTAAIMAAASAYIGEPKTVYLTRPFVYAIVDDNTGLPVFAGAVNTVGE